MAENKKAKTASPPEMKPTLSLTAKELPAITKWKVGETYKIVLTVKQTGKHETDGEYGGEKENRASFEILDAERFKDPELEGWDDESEDE